MEGYDAGLAIFTKRKYSDHNFKTDSRYKKDDLVAKCFEGLFGALAQTSNFSVQVELYSIYSDTCYDPLTKMSISSNSVKIRLNEEKGLFLAGTTMKSVSNYAELCTLFEIASRNIALSMIGTTWMIHGCRLHIEHGENHKCLFELFDIPYRPYRPHNHDASTNHEYRKYVDRVVTALLKNQTGLTKQHVPYRDCSLTWLMSKCLGGNSYAVALFGL